MMCERAPCVYILANRYNGATYVGVTSNLVGRILQHREGTFDGHTKTYGIQRLVYYEVAETVEAAIRREKQLKRWRREWKRNLIERQNPAWNDLAVWLEPLALARRLDGFRIAGTMVWILAAAYCLRSAIGEAAVRVPKGGRIVIDLPQVVTFE